MGRPGWSCGAVGRTVQLFGIRLTRRHGCWWRHRCISKLGRICLRCRWVDRYALRRDRGRPTVLGSTLRKHDSYYRAAHAKYDEHDGREMMVRREVAMSVQALLGCLLCIGCSLTGC